MERGGECVFERLDKLVHKGRYLGIGVLFVFFSSFLHICLLRGILFCIFACVTYSLGH